MQARKLEINIYQLKKVKLIKKYDGEFPDRYFKEILNYIKLKPQTFFNYKINLDPHNLKGKWYLRHNCWGGGVDD